jgi:hypothetical protein
MILPGFHSTLISRDFAARLDTFFSTERLGEPSRAVARQRLRRWWRQAGREFGPAIAVRAIFDRGARPLLAQLGFETGSCAVLVPNQVVTSRVIAPAAPPHVLLVTRWNEPLEPTWRRAVRLGIHHGSRWSFGFNGRQLRITDTGRTYARHFLAFDLDSVLEDESAFAVFWALTRAAAFEQAGGWATGTGRPGPSDRTCTLAARRRPASAPAGTLMDEVIALSERHATMVCRSLRLGVEHALVGILEAFAGRSKQRATASHDLELTDAFQQALTVIYRILFLLFAEARGLVPAWHPIYRESYTIESLREAIDGGERACGLWESLQAISRLAHHGCQAGSLKVTAFNGRLFAPARAPLAETLPVTDAATARILLALTSRPGRAGMGRERIAYADLGVEQLGAVYERVLDYTAHRTSAPGRAAPSIRLQDRSGRRKATGTFYTPRSMTDYLVRRALQPLVHDRPAEAILDLKVLDPAMGSGAFLVSACRYLAAAYESGLTAAGEILPEEVTEAHRAKFRRMIAQRCLFGVDLNPMAVQLARLSIWLATLAADRPLTFLDHHLRIGDSLLGASLEDVARQPPSARPRPARHAVLPLFEAEDLHAVLGGVVPLRTRLASDPDDSVRTVRSKERVLAELNASNGPLSRWKRVADLWCACWFWGETLPAAPAARAFPDAADAILHDRSSIPVPLVRQWMEHASRVATERRFFHWTLEFPEVFFDERGRPRPNPGFDVIVGNPPWNVLRGDEGDAEGRRAARAATAPLVGFTRGSGIYPAQKDGHPNLYQLFIERALTLTRRGGRLGLLVPGGLASDQGCAPLRRRLLDTCDTDAIIGFENRAGVFPIHRSVKFLLVTATTSSRTERVHCRFGERDPSALDGIPDAASDAPDAAFPIVLSPAFLRRISGDSLAIPDLRTAQDFHLLEKLSATVPALGDPLGWGAAFGRELNASDDRPLFASSGQGWPVLEGKQISAFQVDVAASRYSLPEPVARSLVERGHRFDRPRLAYRDVASPTNRMTLIAAVLPPCTASIHTLFCLRSGMDTPAQHVLCALLNSYVANYLVRQRVVTHLSAALMGRLPVPRPERHATAFQELALLAARLAATPMDESGETHVRLQATAAQVYGLTPAEFRHVLTTFPLVATDAKAAALRELSRRQQDPRPAGSLDRPENPPV